MSLGLGLGVGMGIGNMASTYITNQQNMKFSREMYGLQRQHALDDWNRNALYNAPTQQMSRLKSAGLNPHLMYGKGTVGQMQMPRSATNQAVNLKAPQFNPQGIIEPMLAEAKLKNLEAQTNATNAQAAKNLADTKYTGLQGYKFEELRDSIIDEIVARKHSQQAQTLYTLDKNQREALKNPHDIQKVITSIMLDKANTAKSKADRDRILADIKKIKATTDLTKYDLKLRKEGISPNDPMYLAALISMLDKAKQSKSKRKGKKKYKKDPMGWIGPYFDNIKD